MRWKRSYSARGEIDGRDSYCRAEHLTGLLGGADLFIYLFPFSLSQLNSAICAPPFLFLFFYLHNISVISPVIFRQCDITPPHSNIVFLSMFSHGFHTCQHMCFCEPTPAP